MTRTYARLLLIEYVADTATEHDATKALLRKDKSYFPIPVSSFILLVYTASSSSILTLPDNSLFLFSPFCPFVLQLPKNLLIPVLLLELLLLLEVQTYEGMLLHQSSLKESVECPCFPYLGIFHVYDEGMFYCSLWLRGNQIRAVEIFILVVSPAIYNYTALYVLSISRVIYYTTRLRLLACYLGLGTPQWYQLLGSYAKSIMSYATHTTSATRVST